MPKSHFTDITIVLDKSGSMSRRKLETIAGYNQFMADQRKVGGECRVTLVTFNTSCHTEHKQLPIDQLPELNERSYRVGGNTALFDAIGTRVRELATEIADMPDHARPNQVLFLIVTDGYENASTQFGQQQIKQMIEHQEEVYEWEFLYIGAGQNAVKTSKAFGIKAGKALSIGLSGASQTTAWKTGSRAVTSYRMNGKPRDDEFFTDNDRAENS